MPWSVEAIVKRDRLVIAGCIALIIALAWGYLLAGAGMGSSAIDMTRMSIDEAMHLKMGMESTMMQPATWTLGYVLIMFLMWWVMMVAMMLPAAAPTILLAAALNRRGNPSSPPYGAAGFFVAGYLLAWGLFSLIAVAAQWGLERSGLISSMLRLSSSNVAGGLLIAAALWQFTPLKIACLRHCRTPMHFLTQRRRKGDLGALVMGLEHGMVCLGCCWFLMALLFVGGVMNLYWIVGLALLVLIEKVLPFGQWIGRVVGAGMGMWGLGLLAGVV